ncbi:MAG TPA: aconitase family protein [Candidatus Eisenbacteria bacterium]
MSKGLTHHLIESHRVAFGGPLDGAGAGDGALALRIDHALVDGPDGSLVLRAFEAAGGGRIAIELALVCGAPGALCGIESAQEQIYLERTSRRCRATFSRSGNGIGSHVYCSRFAAPGRTALGIESGIAACGALGVLGFVASEVEVAAALAGLPYTMPRTEVLGVALVGRPSAWVGGQDVVLELKRRLGGRGAGGRVIEVLTSGARALTVSDRLSVARRAAELGARAVVFPSDEETRRFLKGQGREADWKALGSESDAECDQRLELDVATLEPLVARADGGDVMRAREIVGRPIRGVWIGRDADVEDLTRFVRRLRGRKVHPDVNLVVAVGSRQVWQTAARRGVLAELIAAGARVVHGDEDARQAMHPYQGVALGFGVGPGASEAGDPAMGWELDVAGPEVCAASAVAGVIMDPRVLDPGQGEIVTEPDESQVLDDGLLIRPVTDPPSEGPSAAPGIPLGRPIEGPLRGTVLLKAPDHLRIEQILPWGPRTWRSRARIPVLSHFTFAGLDAGFVARATSEGGGWVVAGAGFGAGPGRPQAALVLAQLGVRAVLACSLAPPFRRQFLLLGGLALRFAAREDYDHVASGDELEIPDLADGLEVQKPLVVRNLTQGTQYTVRHELSTREIAVARAGGLLPVAATFRSAAGRRPTPDRDQRSRGPVAVGWAMPRTGNGNGTRRVDERTC